MFLRENLLTKELKFVHLILSLFPSISKCFAKAYLSPFFTSRSSSLIGISTGSNFLRLSWRIAYNFGVEILFISKGVRTYFFPYFCFSFNHVSCIGIFFNQSV